MDYNETKEALNIMIGDTGNVTFTPEEKDRALTRAWRDPYVVRVVWNSALTYASGTFQYALPSGITTVKEVCLRRSSSDYPEPVDSDLWEVIGSNLQLSAAASSVFTDGDTIYLKGNYKLNENNDTLTEVALQEYVVDLAGFETLKLLGFKKANLFLKNDTSMGELIALRRELERSVKEGRLRLLKAYENA